MPYTEAIRNSFILAREKGFAWLVFAIFSAAFSFGYCPNDHSIKSISKEVDENRQEVLDLVKRIEQLQGMRYLVENQDPFTMERLIREEFRLKKNKPTAN